MTFIKHSVYRDVQFVWVSSFYDLALKGLCLEQKELCLFKTDYDTMKVSIYHLAVAEKIRWILRKLLFEWCVGYHFSYPQRALGQRFRYRNPKWFSKIVFRVYFYLWKAWKEHRK